MTSSFVVFVVKNRPAGTESAALPLRGLEDNLPGLLTWLMLAWPAALLRIVPLVLPLDSRRGRSNAAAMTGAPYDPRFEWVEVTTPGGPEEWIRGRCHHLTPLPVRAYATDELVARLCPDCDAQLPAPAEPVWMPTA